MRRLAVCTLLSGCSFVFVHPPKRDRAPGTPLRCTTDPSNALLDYVIGVTSGVALASTLNDPMPGDEIDRQLRRVQQTISGTVTAIYIGSAIYGMVATDRCQRAFYAAR